jgi:hypothetical protein
MCGKRRFPIKVHVPVSHKPVTSVQELSNASTEADLMRRTGPNPASIDFDLTSELDSCVINDFYFGALPVAKPVAPILASSASLPHSPVKLQVPSASSLSPVKSSTSIPPVKSTPPQKSAILPISLDMPPSSGPEEHSSYVRYSIYIN